MKKKLLVISHDYIPIYNANVGCLCNIIPLIQNEYEIDVLAAKYKFDCRNLEYIDGVKIYRVADLSYMFFNEHKKIRGIYENNPIFVNLIKLLFSKIFFLLPFYIFNRLHKAIFHYCWKYSAIKKATILVKQNKYDAVIAISAFFINAIIASEVKKKFKYINSLIFELDPYTYNITQIKNDKNNNQLKKRLFYEKQVYSTIDNIALNTETYNTIKDTELNKFKNKISIIEIPSLISSQLLDYYNEFDKENLNIVYTGLLLKDIRNPIFMLDMFLKVKESININLHIYGMGCEDILKRYISKYDNKLILHGLVSKYDAIKAIQSADILINIGNKTNTQTPSKIFEYISSCKPIINLYSIDDDTSKLYLNNYPLSLSIRENKDEIDKCAQEIINFINKTKTAVINKKDIINNYKKFTPEYVSKQILKLID